MKCYLRISPKIKVRINDRRAIRAAKAIYLMNKIDLDPEIMYVELADDFYVLPLIQNKELILEQSKDIAFTPMALNLDELQMWFKRGDTFKNNCIRIGCLLLIRTGIRIIWRFVS